jgi:hypothetical protein
MNVVVQAELLAQVAKDGWRNTMRTIVIWAFAHNIQKGYMVSLQITITTLLIYMST